VLSKVALVHLALLPPDAFNLLRPRQQHAQLDDRPTSSLQLAAMIARADRVVHGAAASARRSAAVGPAKLAPFKAAPWPRSSANRTA